MLLLRRRVQEQYTAPESEASKRFSNIANALQEEAWTETFHVQEMWEILGCER